MANSNWENEFIAPPLSKETLTAFQNAPLPDSDALIARPWLLAADKELVNINDEIQSLELARIALEAAEIDGKIQRLELRRRALLPSVEAYRVALAPHKILPIDVVRKIFLCAAQITSAQADLNEVVDPCPPDRLEIRLILCRVCSAWRSLALDTTELWSDVRVFVPPENTTHLLYVLEIWLSRSLQCALTLDIDGETNDPRITQLLTDYSWRFRSLSVRPENPVLNLPAGYMDRLEILAIDLSSLRGPWPLAPITAFEGAARLRCLTLKRSHNLNFQFFAIPWRQLTELYLDDIFSPPSHLYPVLAQCETLTTAGLSVFHNEPIPLADRNITLPRLRTLELDDGDLTNYARFLHRFDFPSLEDLTLHIHNPADDTTFNVTALPAVRHLCIDLGRVQGPMLVAWLAACSSAAEVRLPLCGMEDSMLDQISCGSLLPNVEILTMQAANLDTLIDTLQTRKSSLQHSTITEVNCSGWLTKRQVERLTDLFEVGVFVASLPKGKRGEIEERARLDFKAGSGLFQPSSS
ncbi:hypothetical protein C8R44DRAFT_221665 [Mycena epipterygia]|nr:hypothetical protein C8R44DRAFT_221665 [Mycena epipterygia]